MSKNRRKFDKLPHLVIKINNQSALLLNSITKKVIRRHITDVKKCHFELQHKLNLPDGVRDYFKSELLSYRIFNLNQDIPIENEARITRSKAKKDSTDMISDELHFS